MSSSGGGEKGGRDSSGGEERRESDQSSSETNNSEVGASFIPSLSFAADPLAAVAAGEAFAVVPLEWCPHLEFPNALNEIPQSGIDVRKVVSLVMCVFGGGAKDCVEIVHGGES